MDWADAGDRSHGKATALSSWTSTERASTRPSTTSGARRFTRRVSFKRPGRRWTSETSQVWWRIEVGPTTRGTERWPKTHDGSDTALRPGRRPPPGPVLHALGPPDRLARWSVAGRLPGRSAESAVGRMEPPSRVHREVSRPPRLELQCRRAHSGGLTDIRCRSA